MKTKDFSIIQITPADGFSAVFTNEDATVYTRPVACWALTRRVLVLEDDDWEHLEKMDFNLPAKENLEHGKPIEFTRVEGEVCNRSHELTSCESEDYFLGYIGPGENPLDFQEQARDLIDAIDDEGDEDESSSGVTSEEEELLTDALPQALSHLSVQVQESIRAGKMPLKWEQGGWLEFMRRFGDLSGG